MIDVDQLRDELTRGLCGADVAESFRALSPDEQTSILRVLKLQELSDGRRLYLRAALQALFPVGDVYFYEGKFLLCLPDDESPAALSKVALIKNLFMDAGNSRLEVYFARHVGVFGTPRTMRLDEIILY